MLPAHSCIQYLHLLIPILSKVKHIIQYLGAGLQLNIIGPLPVYLTGPLPPHVVGRGGKQKKGLD